MIQLWLPSSKSFRHTGHRLISRQRLCMLFLHVNYFRHFKSWDSFLQVENTINMLKIVTFCQSEVDSFDK